MTNTDIPLLSDDIKLPHLGELFSEQSLLTIDKFVELLHASNLIVWFVDEKNHSYERLYQYRTIGTQLDDSPDELQYLTHYCTHFLNQSGTKTVQRHTELHCERQSDFLITPLFQINSAFALLELRAEAYRTWSDNEQSSIFALANATRSDVLLHYTHLLALRNDRLEDLLHEISELATVGGWELDIMAGSVYLTEYAQKIFVPPLPPQLPLTEFLTVFLPEERRNVINFINNARTEGIHTSLQITLNGSLSARRWIHMSAALVKDTHNRALLRGAIDDISRHKNLEVTEQDGKQYLQAILNNLHDALVVTDSEGVIQHTNHALKIIFDYSEKELKGANIDCLMPAKYAVSHKKFMNDYLVTGEARIIGTGRELTGKKKDGREFAIELTLSEFRKGTKRLFIGIIRDITERKQAQETIYQLAYFNKLTGVQNRIAFDEKMVSLLSQKLTGNYYICAMMIDIDGFARFNLAYGMKQGDQIITLVANRIRRLLPSNSAIYYNQADKFLLMHKQLIAEEDLTCLCQQHNIVNSVFSSLNEPVYVGGNPHVIRLTIAGTRLLSKNTDSGEIIQSLELAVSEGKQSGGNCFIEVDEHKNALYRHKTQLALAIQQPTVCEEFFLAVQPQFNTQRQLCGAEVLIRWHSPKFGHVSPAEFIPVAEESNSILAIGTWVLDESFRLLHNMLSKKTDISISINISARQIAQPDFIESLEKRLLLHHVPATCIVLELTETTLMNDREDVQAKLSTLKKIGFNTSIDDFGTGYSSLQYLNDLAIDELKIDKSFVDKIYGENEDVPIINSIINMAKALGMTVVAEGVEKQQQFTYLHQRGCDVIQGYLLGKPIPAKRWLEDLV